jgi:predicted DNA-binding protein (UPF0251 family)/predicted Fe-Mo cluster-binding NifX family protein
MARPIRKRCVFLQPESNYFKPAGIPLKDISVVILFYEELESLRLKELEGYEQKEAAKKMNVSQPTFHRILTEARKKISDALVNGKAIKIEGGNFIMKKRNKEELTLALSADSDKSEGNIDSRFGRCPYFFIVTFKDNKVVQTKAIKNLHQEMQGGAGIAAVELLAKQDVDAVVTGTIGPRALDVLKQFNIAVYQFQGSIQEAIESFIQKKLIEIKE